MALQEVEARELGQPTSESAKQLRNLMTSAQTGRLNLSDIWVNRRDNIRELRGYTQEDIDEMAAQIEGAGGLLAPLGVCRIPVKPETDNKEYTLVWGFRRTLALQQLAEQDPKFGEGVLVQVVDETETKGATRIVQLIENMARRQLNSMEIAIAAQEALDDKECDFNQKDIARLIGRSEANVSQLLKLLKLPKEVQEMISTGKLTFSHARVLMETVPERQWIPAATRGATMTFDDFKDEMEKTYGDSSEEKSDGEGGEKKSSQKPPKMLRATEVSSKYVPFVKEQVEKADSEAKTYTAKDLAQARLDTLNTVLLSQETGLAKEIAPYLKNLEETEAKEKAEAEADKEKAKFFRQAAKRVEAIMLTPPDPSKPDAPRPVLSQAYSQVGQETAATYGGTDAKNVEARKSLKFPLDLEPAKFVHDLAEAYSEMIKDREENKKKKEEREKKKAEEEAKKAAEGGSATEAAAATASA